VEYNAMILPAALFILTYAAIMTERVNRAIVALLDAGAAIAFGLLDQEEAVGAIDEMSGDPRLLKWSLIVISLALVTFVLARTLGLEAGTIALLGAAVMMLFDTWPRHRDSHAELVSKAFREVEWITIFFFVGLFVIIGTLEKAGVLEYLAKEMLSLTGGDVRVTALAVLWASAILSTIVDNIPFVTTMIPLVQGMAPAMGGEEAILPVWWALALSACLGGNGTLVGASANLIVAGIAEKSGAPIGFLPFTLMTFPQMLLSRSVTSTSCGVSFKARAA
jgi:Na+/H+ antiporter NhaD/arsenite permease-like protein